jgi:hypothetical protein
MHEYKYAHHENGLLLTEAKTTLIFFFDSLMAD